MRAVSGIVVSNVTAGLARRHHLHPSAQLHVRANVLRHPKGPPVFDDDSVTAERGVEVDGLSDREIVGLNLLCEHRRMLSPPLSIFLCRFHPLPHPISISGQTILQEFSFNLADQFPPAESS